MTSDSISVRQATAAASHAAARASVYSALDRLDAHALIATGVAAPTAPTLRGSSPQLNALAEQDGITLRSNVVSLIEGDSAEMAAINARLGRITTALGI